MDKIFEIGINEYELKNMLEQVPNIACMDSVEISDKIDILIYVGCVNRHIKNILISNPYYLDRSNGDIFRLIKYMNEIGFSNLNLLFDSNPYFLNYDVFEIENYINKKINSGINLDDIIDEISDNPYVMDEE